MRIEVVLQQKVAEAIQSLYHAKIPVNVVQVQETRKEFTGDFTLVVFPLLRYSRKNPQETAAELGQFLQHHIEDITNFEILQGFLNLTISESYWVKQLQQINQRGFEEKATEAETIMVEYSSPNTNKPLHLGHIRNILLGHSISEILKERGNKVIKANLINDRGIHICKSMIAYQKFGNGETPESSGMKGDHLIGKYYVEFDKAYKREIETLVHQGAEPETAKKVAPLIKEAQEMLTRWEQGEEKVRALWEKMNNWAYSGFKETYDRMGVDFDKIYYESETYLLGKKMVQEGLEKSVFYRKENGSVWVDLTDEGLDEKLLLRADGTSVYITQDLGTAQLKFNDYNLDHSVYIVGNEQDYHFKVLSRVLKKLDKPFWNKIYHLSYGMVDLPSGRMKSREGTVVDADDLMQEMYETAKETSEEAGKSVSIPAENQVELYRQIGLGALKYYILRTDPKKRMVFNPAESIDFHGNTGPFIQYTHARIRSIFRKAGEGEVNTAIAADVEVQPQELEIIKMLYSFPQQLQKAADELSPAVIAAFAYELAKSYNKFYHEHQVLQEENEQKRQLRLTLSLATSVALKKSLNLLGIEAPEKM